MSYAITPVNYEWWDVTLAPHKQLSIGNDQTSKQAMSFGFLFDFFGKPYGAGYASSEGFLAFLIGQPIGLLPSTRLSTYAHIKGAVFGLWENHQPEG